MGFSMRYGTLILQIAPVSLSAPLLQINQKGGCSELQVVAELFLPIGDLDVCPKATSGQDPFVSQLVTVQMWHIEKLLLKDENYHHSNH